MIIGFKYVNEEQENKDLHIFPVGRISTNQFLFLLLEISVRH